MFDKLKTAIHNASVDDDNTVFSTSTKNRNPKMAIQEIINAKLYFNTGTEKEDLTFDSSEISEMDDNGNIPFVLHFHAFIESLAWSRKVDLRGYAYPVDDTVGMGYSTVSYGIYWKASGNLVEVQ